MSGSSPHTRGAHGACSDDFLHVGIIPAYAGSTHTYQSRLSTTRDHPRIRGEHVVCVAAYDYTLGSSPHTRGAHVDNFHAIGDIGIIPAYAGSTFGRFKHAPSVGDHPRIRGEHRQGGACLRSLRGSSPHTRGAPRLIIRNRDCVGIIPAYAGSTSRSRRVISWPRDHPRIRGEHRSRR